MWGKMCVLKNSCLVDKGMYRLILLRRVSFLLMVDTMVVICFSHDKLWSIVTPKLDSLSILSLKPFPFGSLEDPSTSHYYNWYTTHYFPIYLTFQFHLCGLLALFLAVGPLKCCQFIPVLAIHMTRSTYFSIRGPCLGKSCRCSAWNAQNILTHSVSGTSTWAWALDRSSFLWYWFYFVWVSDTWQRNQHDVVVLPSWLPPHSAYMWEHRLHH